MSSIAHIEREIVLHGRRDNQCWFAPSMAVAPSPSPREQPAVMVMAMQLTANDNGPCHYTRTRDLGRRWTPPMESQGMHKIPLEDDTFRSPCLRPVYHRRTDTLLAIGETSVVRDMGTETAFKMERALRGHQPATGYTAWNPEHEDFEPWREIVLPDGFPAVRPFTIQVHEEPDGTILCPVFTCEPDFTRKAGTVAMRFDGSELTFTDSGRMVGLDQPRGLVEPSLVAFDGQYYLTIRSEYRDAGNRHDGCMYRAVSDNGLDWSGFAPWRWDDGAIVETENTQQHWLKHGEELYLMYTRKNQRSNGVFRSRAPLWIARVDVDGPALVRSSEQVVFPANGARMGNFCVGNVLDNEAWIIVGEWVEGYDPTLKPGSRFAFDFEDNHKRYNRIQYIGDLLLARIRFD